MSKEKVFEFLSTAVEDARLKDKLETIIGDDELATLGQEEGFDFSPEHIEEALTELKQRPKFFSKLAEAVWETFNPSQGKYPAIGVQPFTGEFNHES